ncbi:MAG: hypothetical protein QM785_18170 [Pyrinomonadaceae bacterium]
MQIGSEGEFHQCFKCNYEAIASGGRCPRCGNAKFLTSSNIRKRGIGLVIVGLFLAGFMGAIAVFVALLIAGSLKDPQSAKRFNSEFSTFVVIYLLFGAVIVFGIHSVISGIWMIAAGKRNRFLVWVMWALLIGLAVIGGIAGSLVSR